MVINFFNYLYLELNKQHKIQQKTILYNTTYMSIDGGSNDSRWWLWMLVGNDIG